MAADLQALLDAVSSPVRREILWLTWDAERTVGDIGSHFDIAGPTLSSHLATLRDAGLVSMRVDGNFRRYRCNQVAVRDLLPFLAANDQRWIAADDIAERDHAIAAPGLAVHVAVDVPLAPPDAFDAFVDGDRYSAWLGAPVHIRDGRFRATMEWGTEVRGTYELVHPPELLAMRWDFDDGAVPLPGRNPLVAYLRVYPTDTGSRVTVDQLAANPGQLSYLTDAWTTVLGRFAEHHARPVVGPKGRRAPRPKRRR